MPLPWQLIKRIKMNTSGNQMWFSLTCINVDMNKGYRLESASGASSAFNMGDKLTYAFDEVDVSCNAGPGIKYLTEAKLIMNYDTNPDSAVFDLQCSSVIL